MSTLISSAIVHDDEVEGVDVSWEIARILVSRVEITSEAEVQNQKPTQVARHGKG